MKIVWFSWKDINHPQAGGAETVSWQIMRRLVRDGHQVKLITARYVGSTPQQTIDGVEIIRNGGRLSVYPKAFIYFRKHLSKWPDLVIDEMNTLPFGSGFYTRRRNLLLAYQLARQVWHYEASFPISTVGYLVEPIYLFILSLRYKLVLTESRSSQKDFTKYGFSGKKIQVFRVGSELKPMDKLVDKPSLTSLLVLGSVRPMKRTLSAVKGFELARDDNSELTLTIAGGMGSKYAHEVLNYVESSRHKDAIKILGRVDAKQKLELMQDASAILVTSIKEGWGLIVTEANSQGTPAIAYDCDGLRDSVVDGETGVLVPSGDEAALGASINRLLSDKPAYDVMRQKAWEDSKQYTFENSYSDFIDAAKIREESGWTRAR